MRSNVSTAGNSPRGGGETTEAGRTSVLRHRPSPPTTSARRSMGAAARTGSHKHFASLMQKLPWAISLVPSARKVRQATGRRLSITPGHNRKVGSGCAGGKPMPSVRAAARMVARSRHRQAASVGNAIGGRTVVLDERREVESSRGCPVDA